MTTQRLRVGDAVIHPRYGFGTVKNVLTQEHDGADVEYYEIGLSDNNGMLSVPVEHAADLGLRRLVNGVAATLERLREKAQPLPEHARLRSLELSARWNAPEPGALAGGVRDLLGYARQFGIKGMDLQWLTRACERLGAEAAQVDGITLGAARHAISQEVSRLKTPPPVADPPAAKPARSHRRHAA